MNLFILSLRIMVRVTLITIIIGSLMMNINSGGGEAAPARGAKRPSRKGAKRLPQMGAAKPPPFEWARSAPLKLGAKRPI